jgi:superfamily I DNA/RNA helicase
MEFRIADTFTDSLGRLTGDEQKLAKTTAFDLQVNHASPGLRFHKLDRARDKSFWSVRVNADIRIIVHRTGESLMLCYVAHHDKAYDWAERRKIEIHPRTGAAQLVEIREMVQEVLFPVPAAAPQPRGEEQRPFAGMAEDELLGYGVPPEWVADVKAVTLDGLLPLADHLPAEAAEALLELATGGKPRKPHPAAETSDPYMHPDAQRRFRILADVEELQRALDAPWEKWIVFLHPEQRQWVERDYSGPARVAGSAGTGKTIVALHRAVYLARKHTDSRVLLTTYSDTLAHALRARTRRLVAHEPRLAERLEVSAIDALGVRLCASLIGEPRLASREDIRALIAAASAQVAGHRFGPAFLLSEWEQVVDSWQLADWEGYRDVARLGRKTRLPEAQRAKLWAIFEKVQTGLADRGLTTLAAVFTNLARHIAQSGKPPFDFAVVDEAQDLTIPQMRFLAALGASRPDALFFAADQGQRIFQQPFSWKALGVDIRGRSRTLRVNYRTSHQIRTQADRLLGPAVTDADGNVAERNDTISVFNGPSPTIRVAPSEEAETELVADWLARHRDAGLRLSEVAVFVRSAGQIDRARHVVERAGVPYKILDDHHEVADGHLVIATMHLAKGLEFRAVAVMACDDEVVPLQERIESITDEADIQDVYDTERHLLYVACTRARDYLLVSAVAPGSEFIEDLGAEEQLGAANREHKAGDGRARPTRV